MGRGPEDDLLVDEEPLTKAKGMVRKYRGLLQEENEEENPI
jgi:hypothetical protein